MIHNKQNAQVTFTREILNPDGSVAQKFAPQKNLILDQGLNNLGTGTVNGWANSFSACVLGTGTTPTRRDSGVITFTRAGNIVTASASFFEAQDVGRILKFDTGEEMYVTVFTSSTQVTVSTSGTLAAAEGTIWYVNATSHQTETKRSSTYSSDGGANGFNWNGTTKILSLFRTFLFTAETGSVIYREIGWSHTTTAGPNLFGRALIAGGGDGLIAGQIYKVKVQLDIEVAGTDEVNFTVPTGIWAGATGKTRIEGVQIGSIDVNGIQQGARNLDPSVSGEVSINTASTALAAPQFQAGTIVSGQLFGTNLVANSYIVGSFTRTFTATIGVNDANSTAIRSIQFRTFNGLGQASLRLLFDAAQTKTSSQSMSITWRKSWGRVLVN